MLHLHRRGLLGPPPRRSLEQLPPEPLRH